MQFLKNLSPIPLYLFEVYEAYREHYNSLGSDLEVPEVNLNFDESLILDYEYQFASKENT